MGPFQAGTVRPQCAWVGTAPGEDRQDGAAELGAGPAGLGRVVPSLWEVAHLVFHPPSVGRTDPGPGPRARRASCGQHSFPLSSVCLNSEGSACTSHKGLQRAAQLTVAPGL